MRYEFYPDVFWVTNFGMDMLVLLLVRYVKKSRGSKVRVLLASAFGATGSVLLFLSLSRFMLYQLMVHLLLNPLMILIAFPVKSVRGFGKDFLMTYVLMLLVGGTLSWGMGSLGQWKYFWLWAVGACGICMLILHWVETRKLEQKSYEILLLTGDRNLALTGFWDTGNLLMDPVLNQPVHIIQEILLEEEVAKEQLAIRYIPFHSLGQENGLLPVVTLKAMYVKGLGEKRDTPPVYIERPVFGLAKEKLFQNRDYQIILNAKSIL